MTDNETVEVNKNEYKSLPVYLVGVQNINSLTKLLIETAHYQYPMKSFRNSEVKANTLKYTKIFKKPMEIKLNIST